MVRIEYDCCIRLKTIKHKYYDSVVILHFRKTFYYDVNIGLFFTIPQSDNLDLQSSYSLPSNKELVLSYIKNTEKLLKLRKIKKEDLSNIFDNKLLTYANKARVFEDESIIEDNNLTYIVDINLDNPSFIGRKANYEDFVLSVYLDYKRNNSIDLDSPINIYHYINFLGTYGIEITTKNYTYLVRYELINANTNQIVYCEDFSDKPSTTVIMAYKNPDAWGQEWFRKKFLATSYRKYFKKDFLKLYNLNKNNIVSRIYYKEMHFFPKGQIYVANKDSFQTGKIIDDVSVLFTKYQTKISYNLITQGKVYQIASRIDYIDFNVDYYRKESDYIKEREIEVFYFGTTFDIIHLNISDYFKKSSYSLENQNNPAY